MKASSSSSATGIHRFSWWSNSNSVPSDSWTAMNLLSSLEYEMRSSFSNSAGSVGKVKTSATGCSAMLLGIGFLWRYVASKKVPELGVKGAVSQRASNTKVPSSPNTPGRKHAAGVRMLECAAYARASDIIKAQSPRLQLVQLSFLPRHPITPFLRGLWLVKKPRYVQQALCSSNELHDT